MQRNLVVLGSTGSIGLQTLDIVRSFPDLVTVIGLAAGSRISQLEHQCREFGATCAAIGAASSEVDWSLPNVPLLRGIEGLVSLAENPEADIVVVGTVGAAGLLPALAALRTGKLVALANKEALVMAGPLVQSALVEGHGTLVPIDSEHSAIWQCLQGEHHLSIERLLLTASGGALRDIDAAELGYVTPQQALRHPTWSMGPKITIDSATLMNKGLEVLEARWLFNLPLDNIDLLLHHQSIVHSLVTFTDSSTKAQMGLPDMRLPIQYALSHPERWPNSLERLDLATVRTLTFDSVDLNRYPCVRLALDAGRAGDTYPAVLCAADEVAVDAFLKDRIRLTEIAPVIDATLQAHTHCPRPELQDILDADGWARRVATGLVAEASAI
jgi:1-deoxy-D-xylulose-5-phosphate reductoisomerase